MARLQMFSRGIPRLLMMPALLALAAGAASATAQGGATEAGERAARGQDAAGRGGVAHVAMLEISGNPGFRRGILDALTAGADDEQLSMLEILGRLRTVATDDRYDGVVIRLKDAELGQTQAQEIGRAIRRVREAGKKVQVFAEGYGAPELLLGSHADQILLQEGGVVSLPGMYMEEIYLGDTLRWIGVQPDFVQIGDYKGASEQMARGGPSDEWSQNIEGLLDSLYANMRAQLSEGLGLSDRQLDAAMEQAFMAYGGTAERLGLIHATVDLPDLYDAIDEYYGADAQWTELASAADAQDDMSAMMAANPLAGLMQIVELLEGPEPQRATAPAIAILTIDGAIVDGESGEGGPFGGEMTVGSRTIRNAIEDILDQDLIQGVIVRVDSPGGSAIASEVIWQGLRRLAEEKPVWVSIGSMAASGGYYVSVAGERIYVNPSSVVGSIGVVGGKLALGPLFEKVKINAVGRARGPHAGLLSMASPWDEAERAVVRESMSETYDLFTSRVQEGRPQIDLSRTAEGRLFTGDVAVKLRMADKIGTIEDALEDMRLALDLPEGHEVLVYPEPPGIDALLESLLGGFGGLPFGGGSALAGDPAMLPMAATLRSLLGRHRFDAIRGQINALMQMQDERVLLVSPRALIVR